MPLRSQPHPIGSAAALTPPAPAPAPAGEAPESPVRRPILWYSNSPAVTAQTGYANQTALFVPRFKARLGYDMAVCAFWGQEGGGSLWRDGIPLYPKGARDGTYGNDVFLLHARNWFGGDMDAGLVLTLMDVFVLNIPNLRRCHPVHWLPLDHDPVVPAVLDTLRHGGGFPVAMSRFGQRTLAAAGIAAPLVPHGVETGFYRPGDPVAARRALGLPAEGFIVGMVAANKGTRKCFAEALDAFAWFYRQRQPNDPPLYLYLHTDTTGMYEGVRLDLLIEQLDLPDGVVLAADPYDYFLGYPPEHMRCVYQAIDVLLNPARGEGFGIPILEAAACGTPAVVNDFSAMPEVAGPSPWKVRPAQRWYDAGQGSWQVLPSVEGVAQALQDALVGWKRAAWWADLRRRVREHALAYDADLVLERDWRPVMEQVEEWRSDRIHRRQAQREATALHSVQGRHGPRNAGAATSAEQALDDAVARRDALSATAPGPRDEAHAWSNDHRFGLALELLNARPRAWVESVVLDLGCAEGEFLHTVATRYRPRVAIGVDRSPERIERARRRFPELRFEVGDACAIGLAGEVDVVLCLELVGHVPDPDDLLLAIHQALKPGGLALISTPNDPDGRFVDGLEHRRGYGVETLWQALGEAGMRPVAWRSTVPGLYGPAGLLARPERLPEFIARAAADWPFEAGSHLLVLCERPAHESYLGETGSPADPPAPGPGVVSAEAPQDGDAGGA